MFDVNPRIDGDSLSLNMTESDSTMRFDLALESSDMYGIDPFEAKHMIEGIKAAVDSNWMAIAKKIGLSRNAVAHMEAASDMSLNSIAPVAWHHGRLDAIHFLDLHGRHVI